MGQEQQPVTSLPAYKATVKGRSRAGGHGQLRQKTEWACGRTSRRPWDGCFGAADRIRTSDVQLGKPRQPRSRFSRALPSPMPGPRSRIYYAHPASTQTMRYPSRDGRGASTAFHTFRRVGLPAPGAALRDRLPGRRVGLEPVAEERVLPAGARQDRDEPALAGVEVPQGLVVAQLGVAHVEGAAEYRKLKSLLRRLETTSRQALAYKARRA